MAIDFQRGEPLNRRTATVTIAADRGWQSSGIWLAAGKLYRISATGRYKIASEQIGESDQHWQCEPGGVTIEYHDGRPLGMLLGAIDGRTSKATLASPIDIGVGATIQPVASGTLYLRVNDSGGRLDDNRGVLSVVIAETTKASERGR
jgi:hypothetical protein